MKKDMILSLNEKELTERMTNEDFTRMERLGINISTLLNIYQDIGKASYNENTEFADISEILIHLEEIFETTKEYKEMEEGEQKHVIRQKQTHTRKRQMSNM